MFPEGMDMNSLLEQAQAMQAQIAQAQEQMQKASYTGTAGGDLVTATLNGNGVLTALEIKPEAVDPDDTESLADLVIAAVRDAHEKAQAAAQQMMPNMPNLG